MNINEISAVSAHGTERVCKAGTDGGFLDMVSRAFEEKRQAAALESSGEMGGNTNFPEQFALMNYFPVNNGNIIEDFGEERSYLNKKCDRVTTSGCTPEELMRRFRIKMARKYYFIQLHADAVLKRRLEAQEGRRVYLVNTEIKRLMAIMNGVL